MNCALCNGEIEKGHEFVSDGETTYFHVDCYFTMYEPDAWEDEYDG